MKRFTDTDIWKKPWYRKLTPAVKCLWRYLCDNCDHAGVVDPDWELISFSIGQTVSQTDLESLNGNVVIRNGKLFLPQYVQFQYGKLNPMCKPHIPVLESLERHGIDIKLLYRKPLKGLSKDYQRIQEKEKEKEKEEEGGSKGDCHYHPHARTALHWLNDKSGKHFRETDNNLTTISARLKEPEVDIEGVKKMIDRQVALWKGSRMAEYLRPETLFGQSKFDGYYASKDAPLIEQPVLLSAIPKPPTLQEKLADQDYRSAQALIKELNNE